MGYRDALVGGLLLRAGLAGSDTVPGWFLASAGADLADLLGGPANHDRLSERSRTVGVYGAAAGGGHRRPRCPEGAAPGRLTREAGLTRTG